MQTRGTHSTIYGSGESLVESRPATTRVEFSSGFIERCPTTTTVVDPISIKLVIFPSASQPVFIRKPCHKPMN